MAGRPAGQPVCQYSGHGQRIIHGIIGTKAAFTSYKLPEQRATAPTTEVIVPRHSTVSRLSGPSATIQAPTFDVMLTDTMSYFALIVPEKLPRIRGIKLGFSRSHAVQSNANVFTLEKGRNSVSYPIRWDELRICEVCKFVHRS